MCCISKTLTDMIIRQLDASRRCHANITNHGNQMRGHHGTTQLWPDEGHEPQACRPASVLSPPAISPNNSRERNPCFNSRQQRLPLINPLYFLTEEEKVKAEDGRLRGKFTSFVTQSSGSGIETPAAGYLYISEHMYAAATLLLIPLDI